MKFSLLLKISIVLNIIFIMYGIYNMIKINLYIGIIIIAVNIVCIILALNTLKKIKKISKDFKAEAL